MSLRGKKKKKKKGIYFEGKKIIDDEKIQIPIENKYQKFPIESSKNT